FETREPSPRLVSPLSPPRVEIRVRRTGSFGSRGATPEAYDAEVAPAGNGRQTRQMRRAKSGNVLATLGFTDIVASSQVAEERGGRRWRELPARHHRIVREGLREYGGQELDTAGDGVFARFESPASAINFAAATADVLRELGIEIRAGIHIGECEVFEGKLSGVNVHAAARTMSLAGPGEILVTGSVRDLVRGGGFGFADRGAHALRGIEGEWRLFEVTSIEDSHRSPRSPRVRRRRGAARSSRPRSSRGGACAWLRSPSGSRSPSPPPR